MSERNGQDNRIAILDRAEELFARGGYDAIGVQEIVAAAGVTKPTLYHYFGSKRGVLETLFAERFQPFVDELTAAAAYNHDLTGCLKRVVECYFRFARTHPMVYRLHLASWFGSPESEAAQVVRGYAIEQSRLLKQLFMDASGDHGNMRGRQDAYGVTLLGVVNAWIVMATDDGMSLNDDAVWRTVQQFSYGIYT